MTQTIADVAIPPVKNSALPLAGGTSAIVALLAGLLILQTEAAGWVGGIGAVIVVLGVFVPHRGGVSVGVLIMAVGSLVATANSELGASLIVNAYSACMLIGALIVADLSFVARRATELSPVSVRGFVQVHVVVTVVGVIAAAATVGAVLAVEWPRWLVVVPAAALAGAAVVLTRMVRRYWDGVNVVPQPPPPQGTPLDGPPPPTARTSPRNLRVNMPQPPPPRLAQRTPTALQPPSPRQPPPPPRH